MKIHHRFAVVLIPVALALSFLFGVARLLSFSNAVLMPPANSHTAAVDDAVSVTYPQNVDATTVNTATFAVHAMASGRSGAYSVSGGQIYFEPEFPFLPGELVQASATTGTLFLSGGGPAEPTVWQFRVSPKGGSGLLADSGQSYPIGATFDAALGDLDGDGDLDAVSIHIINDSLIWTNSGGVLSKSLSLDTGASEAVALGDLNGDSYLDAYFANSGGDQVWLNQDGLLSDSGQLVGDKPARDVALGDLDGDGDLDAVTANYNLFDGNNYIWLNDGQGNFSPGPQPLAGLGEAVSIGDLDNDGDLDLVFGQDATNSGVSTQIWLNDGPGTFVQGTGFGAATRTRDNALGDLDGDGYLDIITANFAGTDTSNRVWINKGSGLFSDSGQALGNTFSSQVALGDLNDDGDLDILVANSGPYELWTNDGGAGFTRSEYSPVGATADLGDLDGDGDLDALLGDINPGRFRLWRNTGLSSGADLGVDVSDLVWLPYPKTTAHYDITITNRGPDLAQGVELSLGLLGDAPFLGDLQWTAPSPVSCWFVIPSAGCDIGQLANGQQVAIEVTLDYQDYVGEDTGAYDMSIPVTVDGHGPDPDLLNNSAALQAVQYICKDPSEDCSLGDIWCNFISRTAINRQVGAIAHKVLALPPFHLPDFYKLRDRIMADTPQGRHYIDLYYTHDAEIGGLLIADSALRGQAIDALAAWQPNVAALVNGEGKSATITGDQVQKVDDFLTSLSAVASPTLQQVIVDERAKLPPPADFTGMSMEEARGLVIGYETYLPAITK